MGLQFSSFILNLGTLNNILSTKQILLFWHYTAVVVAMYRQTAVSACFTSEQILLFTFTWQTISLSTIHRWFSSMTMKYRWRLLHLCVSSPLALSLWHSLAHSTQVRFHQQQHSPVQLWRNGEATSEVLAQCASPAVHREGAGWHGCLLSAGVIAGERIRRWYNQLYPVPFNPLPGNLSTNIFRNKMYRLILFD